MNNTISQKAKPRMVKQIISEINKELLANINETEIRSLRYEDVVYVKNDKVIQYGKVIDTLNTNKKIKDLFNESYENEFGYYPNSKQALIELEKEFGKI